MLHAFAKGYTYESTLDLTVDVRQLAGLITKNYILTLLPHLDLGMQQFVKSNILCAMGDPLPDIRNTAATLAGRIFEAFVPLIWGDMMPPLLHMLNLSSHGQIHQTEGALLAIHRMCEDSPERISMEMKPGCVCADLIPQLFSLFSCRENAMIRQRALESVNSLIFLISSETADYVSDASGGRWKGSSMSSSGNSLTPYLGHLLTGLASLATDPHAGVRKAVCHSFVLIASFSPDILDLKNGSVCQFMVNAVRDKDDTVAMEACEFWTVLVDEKHLAEHMVSHLPSLLPSLISRMHLTVEQITQERTDEIQEASGEKQLTVLKPIHHKVGRDSADLDEREEKEAMARWTLRKSAASLFDTIGCSFMPNLVLPSALPAIFTLLQMSSDEVARREVGVDAVWARETGILALGALSTGSIKDDLMRRSLPQIFAFLFQSLGDPTPEVRSIACWTLSRYCGWIFDDSSGGDCNEGQGDTYDDKNEYFVTMLKGLLTLLQDPTPRVQAASLSALCNLFEYAGDNLIPFLPDILRAAKEASQGYGVKSSLLLTDMIAVLSDSVGEAISDPTLTPLYMPIIMHFFNSLENFDSRLFPILECLTSLLTSMKDESKPYSEQIYRRCLIIIDSTMRANNEARIKAQKARERQGLLKNGGGGSPTAANGQGEYDSEDEDDENFSGQLDDDVPSKDFAICCFDVLSALCEGLGQSFLVLPESTGTTELLLNQTLGCMQDDLPEIRQSAFSLAGEFSRSCVQLILPVAPQYLELIIKSLDTLFPMVTNNSSWGLGELALQVGSQHMSPYMPRLLHQLALLVREPHLPLSLKQNVAITLGRLALTNTHEVASVLPDFFGSWCSCARYTYQQSSDRNHAYGGMVAALKLNQQTLFGTSSVSSDRDESDLLGGRSIGFIEDRGQRRGGSGGSSTTIYNGFAFVLSCASFEDPPPEPLLTDISMILQALKTQTPSSPNQMSWAQMMSQIDSTLASHLRDMFKL